MVSTKLVDGRATPASFGWRFYQVEVHQSNMAPLMGLDRLWRRFDRLDTVPHIRSLGTVAVIGDTLVIGVGGSSVTVWSYDVRTKELTRSPVPDWFNASWVTPPAALSPDGRFIAYLSQDRDTTRLTVRSWPQGRIVAQTPPVSLRPLNPPHGGYIVWGNPNELEANFPVSDSGPSIASLQAVVRGERVEVARWAIYPDYSDPDVRRPIAAPEPAPGETKAVEQTEDQWTRADRLIKRLPPAEFPELPTAFKAELEQAGCTIPQSGFDESRNNVIHGSFGAMGQEDWAVLCSRNGTSSIFMHWGGPVQCPSERLPQSDKNFLQGMPEGIVFSRSIAATTSYHVYPDDDSAGVDREVLMDHDGIDDVFQGKGSTVWLCRGGAWIAFAGGD